MKNKQILRLSALLISCLLTGCASNNFQCPTPQGTQCKPLDEINRMVDRGQLGQFNQNTKQTKRQTPAPQNHHWRRVTLARNVNQKNSPVTAGNLPQAHRLKIWLAPYNDSAGNSHQSETIETFSNTAIRGKQHA